jgi:lipopolysaccharide/colanic/teichoic acid biosynthesis glycosyltransferase
VERIYAEPAAEKVSRHLLRRFLAGVARVVDVVVAIVALIVASPIMLAIAIIIKLDSPGPVLFCQERVGLHSHFIMFWKFRTMFVDAKERFPQMYAYAYTPQEIRWVCLKQPDDPRVTKAGKWLRKSTLDELPNFWNLLKGDVTIVGPRPDIAGALPYFTPEQMIKFSVKPGITGLAQTHGRGRLRFQDQIRYDMFYAKKKSFWLDVHIIFRTTKLLFKSDGAF